MDPFGDCASAAFWARGTLTTLKVPRYSILSHITKLGTELGVRCEKEITGVLSSAPACGQAPGSH